MFVYRTITGYNDTGRIAECHEDGHVNITRNIDRNYSKDKDAGKLSKLQQRPYKIQKVQYLSPI